MVVGLYTTIPALVYMSMLAFLAHDHTIDATSLTGLTLGSVVGLTFSSALYQALSPRTSFYIGCKSDRGFLHTVSIFRRAGKNAI